MINLGSISVTPVVDSVVRLVPTDAYETTSAVDWSRHASLLDDEGFLRLTLGGYVVRSDDRVILVDAGVGPDDRVGKKATMPGGKMLDNLRASGTSSRRSPMSCSPTCTSTTSGGARSVIGSCSPTRLIAAIRPTGTTSPTVVRWALRRSSR